MKNYYEILEVNPKASSDIISKIFKIQIKKNHPDLFQGDEKIAAENKMKEINEAYEVLSNEAKRTEYGKELDIEKENDKNNLVINNIDNKNFNTTEQLINSIKKENVELRQELDQKNSILDELLNSMSDNDYTDFSDKFINNNKKNKDSTENYSYKKESYSKYVINTLKNFLFKIGIIILFTLVVLVLASLFTDIDLRKILGVVFK
jgi:curved DNA-binding protein CbpA